MHQFIDFAEVFLYVRAAQIQHALQGAMIL